MKSSPAAYAAISPSPASFDAHAAGYDFTGVIFRFVSILGERYTHGHVFDFYCALKRDPTRLRVLGDGHQEKSYLYVQDCIDAILCAVAHHEREPGAHVYNLGTEETIVVDESVAIITDQLGLSPTIEHTGGRRGWVGDSPLIYLDTTRIQSIGWKPQVTIREAVVRTVQWLSASEYAWLDRLLPANGHPNGRGQLSEGEQVGRGANTPARIV